MIHFGEEDSFVESSETVQCDDDDDGKKEL